MAAELTVFEEKMKKTLASLEGEYATIRAGRANPHVLDRIMVDYYGTPTPINQVGNVTIPEARLIQIQPWDSTMLKEIGRAISASDLGINPGSDGKVIRLVFPELTEDRRKDLTKDMKKRAEASKVALRNIRRDAIDAFKKMEKSKEIAEDTLKDLEEKTDKLTEKYVTAIDKKCDEKCKDILSV